MCSDQFNLFISYSHEDEKSIEKFIKHISPLKENKLIKEWYDRKILPSEPFQEEIDNNLENADIICLCISASFLSSDSCQKETDKALQLRRKGARVVSLILSDCGWKDLKKFKLDLALPTDGYSVANFGNEDSGWSNIYEGLKDLIYDESKLRNIQNSDSMNKFLNDPEMLKGIYFGGELFLEDIFVYPELNKYDDYEESNYLEKRISSEILVDELINNSKILLAGDAQSGKTSLSKKLFSELRKLNYVPVYLSEEDNNYEGLIANKIKNAFERQYDGISYDEIKKRRIVPIVDDFHHASKKEKIIQDLNMFDYQIILADDIFVLNFKNENIVKNFKKYEIRKFSPSMRNELIRKWICFGKCYDDDNLLYKDLDKATNEVNTTLGKIIGNGLMPSYPFFILSILGANQIIDSGKTLNQNITSQGHCYQALIYIYLTKLGLSNDEVDTYINFLTHISYYFFKRGVKKITPKELDDFLKKYKENFNLPINIKNILKNLKYARIFTNDNFNNYFFNYSYIYYYFIARYLSRNLKDNEELIQDIFSNLHIDENAYISIFIAHHTSDSDILDHITINAMYLFDQIEATKLTKNELNFFDDEIDSIIEASLPPSYKTPESEREKRLKVQELKEENKNEDDQKDEMEDDFAKELRRGIRTVEVIGRIIKNRSGSLKKDKIEEMISEGLDLYLRILAYFLKIIKDNELQEVVISYISTKIEEYIEEQKEKPSNEKVRKIACNIFWNLNFSVIDGIIKLVIQSLGSDQLKENIVKVCDSNYTPAKSIIKHGVLMWHSKNLQIDNIHKELKNSDFSETAKVAMKHLIVDHCKMHKINYKEKQEIESKFGIPAKRLVKYDYKLDKLK